MIACSKCKESKPETEFHRDKTMANGLSSYCKQCKKDYFQAWRRSNIERLREYNSLPHRKQGIRKMREEWVKANPKRSSAQQALYRATRDGIVIPWPVCSISECNSKPEAHHPDYDRPLDVVWLCRAHHMQAHAETAEFQKMEKA